MDNPVKILRYWFMLCGDEIKSAELAKNLVGTFSIDEPDLIGEQADERGVVSVSPVPEIYILDEWDSSYDRFACWFPDFLEANEKALSACYVDDISLFMEVFYIKDDQFNFEILRKDSVSRLNRFNVALPISIYTLTETQMEDWMRELRG